MQVQTLAIASQGLGGGLCVEIKGSVSRERRRQGHSVMAGTNETCIDIMVIKSDLLWQKGGGCSWSHLHEREWTCSVMLLLPLDRVSDWQLGALHCILCCEK